MTTAEKKSKAKRQKRKLAEEERIGKRKHQEGVDSARGLALEDITGYFTDRGLDPAQYQSDIDRALEEAIAGIPQGAGNLPSYFQDMGANIYDELTNAGQTRAMTGLENLFPQDWQNTYVPNTMDDAAIAEILASSRGEADKYMQNLLDRGVVTQAGFTAGQGDIAGQEAKVRALLDQLGGQVLNQGRGELGNIFNEGQMAASNLRLGQTFDPTAYQSRINQALGEFGSGIGDSLKALIPEGGLFQTTGLAARAGAGQGAQNTKFSPNALSGIYEDDENRKASPLSIF